jgi:hypothetical protein
VPDYQAYLKSNMDLAADLSTIVGETVQADNVRTKMEELQAKLGQ